ncbi:MAG: c-type cytochrome [bacterium]
MNWLVRSALAACLILAPGCRQHRTVDEAEGIAPDSSMIHLTDEAAQAETAPKPPLLTYTQQKGKRLYDHYCAVCHGFEGKGDGFNAYNLDPRPKDMTEESYLKAVTDKWLIEAISEGGRGVKRSTLMPSYENTLSREQVADIVTYLRAFER